MFANSFHVSKKKRPQKIHLLSQCCLGWVAQKTKKRKQKKEEPQTMKTYQHIVAVRDLNKEIIWK